MSDSQTHSIAIVGAGNVGTALARHWHAAGHTLHLGVRDPSSASIAELAEELGADAGVPSEAVQRADIVVLSIPGPAVLATVAELAADLSGKTVILPANEMQGGTGNLAAAVAQAAPGTQIIRAFNTIAWERLAESQIDGQQIDMFYVAGEAVDDLAQQLIADCGLRPIRVGDVEQGHLVDSMFATWVALAFGGGRGRGIVFALRGT